VKKATAATLLLGLALPLGAEARVTAIAIDKVEPFAEGTTFGNAGAYERVAGTAKGEVDPSGSRNRGIVNLDKAPRNARGMVEYEADFFMLRPKDSSKGNGKIVYEVNNRGRKFLMHWIMDAPAQAAGANNDPRSAQDAGNGLLFRMGYTMVWSGWDPDAPRAGSGMAMRVPVAQEGGQPIVRTIRDELVSGTRGPQVESFRLSYEAASLDPKEARLTVRRKEADPETEVPAERWTFADARTIRLLPEGTKPEPGSIYQLYYRARDPKVLGLGFAATRDVVSFLRNEGGAANPAGAGVKSVLALGISQSGRYLRDFIGQGFNADEDGRKVFDGVLAHISGVGRVFLNEEFGQPARTNTQHEDHFYPENAFPFSAATLEDPVTGKRGSLLRGDGSDPLLIEVNTSTEYWQKGASLLATDPLGRQDVELPATTRVYMVAGTQHGGQFGLTTAPGPCRNLRNPHNPSAALRALLVALDRWVSDGTAPPASRVPRLAYGTLVPPDQAGFPRLPGIGVARQANALARFKDWVKPAAEPGPQYRPLVPKVDRDGNETSGIRLPDIAVPLATYTGWNLYKEPFPAGELCDRDGSFLPFAKDQTEQETNGDPRAAIRSRYWGRDDYVAKVEAAARDLVRERLLLEEDAAAYVAKARAEKAFE
jgi:hypothetical protein